MLISDDLLSITPETAMKEKKNLDKCISSKFCFAFQKVSIRKVKLQTTEWNKTFVSHLFDKNKSLTQFSKRKTTQF